MSDRSAGYFQIATELAASTFVTDAGRSAGTERITVASVTGKKYVNEKRKRGD